MQVLDRKDEPQLFHRVKVSMDLYGVLAATNLSSNQALLKDAVIPSSGHSVIRQVQSRAAAL